MAAHADARRTEADRLAGYFDAQLRLAAAMAAHTGVPLSAACLEFTNLHRRFGFGRIEAGAPSEGWARFADGLDRCASPAARLDFTLSFFAAAPPEPMADHPFGCFSYELHDEGRAIRIHFSSRDSEGGVGPLVAAKADRRRAELAAMFAHARAQHPRATIVLGGSWLYNLTAYRRLFPPDYAASAVEPPRVRLDGASSWGQLLDFRGALKPAIRDALVANLATLDPAAPWKSFPLRALAARAPLQSFLDFYVA